MTVMACVSEGIISQLLVLLGMILKGTHGSLSEGGAPHPVLSCLALCSCPSFLSSSFFLRKLFLGHFRGSYLPVLTAGPMATWSWPHPGLTRAQSPVVTLLDSVPSAKMPVHLILVGVRGGLEPQNGVREPWPGKLQSRQGDLEPTL